MNQLSNQFQQNQNQYQLNNQQWNQQQTQYQQNGQQKQQQQEDPFQKFLSEFYKNLPNQANQQQQAQIIKQQLQQQQQQGNQQQYNSQSNQKLKYNEVFKKDKDGNVYCNFEDVKKYQESETRIDHTPSGRKGIMKIIEITHQ